jgi:succinylglutamate desuccinylase
MVEETSRALNKTAKFERLIGKYTQNLPGPTLLFIGGIHGNEPAGVFALAQVLREIQKSSIAINGEVHSFAGNLQALPKNRRFIEQDLNRIWKVERIRELQNENLEKKNESIEEKEQKELYESIKFAFNLKKPVYVFDLHTTSSESRPFITIADTLRNRNFAIKFPLPIILGIEEQIVGTLLNYINELGLIAMGFESGQHDAESSVAIHRALIWLALMYAGCLNVKDVPNLSEHYKTLRSHSENGNKVFEVRYRYDIRNGEVFRMLGGFKNFQPIQKGQLLAETNNGSIRSHENGLVFLPLYQNLGNDGYFIVHEIKPFWLKVSAAMRTKNIQKFLPLLPGIKKHPANGNSLIVNQKIARWFVIEFFHLLGYRRKHTEMNKLVVTKRKYDVIGPNGKS